MSISCNKEQEITKPQSEVSQEAIKQGIEPGVSILKLSNEMAIEIENELTNASVPTKSSWTGVVNSLNIRSFHRLFPYDEKYEARQRRAGLHQWYVVEYDKMKSVTKANDSFSNIKGVEIVEPRLRAKQTGFNDPLFSKQWGLQNLGGNDAKKHCDVNVQKVWENYTTGSSKVVVAVIDGGIQLDHPDLMNNIIPAGEGGSRDFLGNSFEITPDDHGTHVAGIIAAVNNNGEGISSIAGGNYAEGKQGVRLMSCQIYKTEQDAHGNYITRYGDFPAAIVWAANNGAHIAQNSWGYPVDQDGDGVASEEEIRRYKQMSTPESDRVAIDYFIKYAGCDEEGNQLPDSPMKGGVVIFAAGNDNVENGIPANYHPVIAVGSITENAEKSYFSNYGDWVDLAAPGSNIYSTIANGKYYYMDGTSMACPQVSGVAALVLSYHGGPGYTNDNLKEALLEGANNNILVPDQKVGPLVDALGAILYGAKEFPAQPSPSFTVNSNSVECTWKHTVTAKGNGATGYMMLATKNRSLLSQVKDLKNLPAGVRSMNIVAPADIKGGETMKATMNKLDFDSEYYLALIAYGYGVQFSGDFEINTLHTSVNHAPVIELAQQEEIRIKTSDTFSIDIHVNDVDGHSVTLTNLPIKGNGKLSIFPVVGEENVYRLTIEAPTFEPGKYILKLTAEDEYGAKDEKEICFSIIENHAPIVIKPLANIISHQIDQKYRLTLSEYIQDPDIEPLEIEIKISNPKVLKMSYTPENDELFIQTLNFGFTTVSIKAFDTAGMFVQMEFSVVIRRKGELTNLYPVPMQDILYIRTGETFDYAKVEILSSTGTIVYKGLSECSAFQPMAIAVKDLAPGTYQVTVKYEGVTSTKTVVKI